MEMSNAISPPYTCYPDILIKRKAHGSKCQVLHTVLPLKDKKSEVLRLEAALLPSPAHILLSHLRAGKVSSAEKRSLPTS